jgi:hypothetical protein
MKRSSIIATQKAISCRFDPGVMEWLFIGRSRLQDFARGSSGNIMILMRFAAREVGSIHHFIWRRSTGSSSREVFRTVDLQEELDSQPNNIKCTKYGPNEIRIRSQTKFKDENRGCSKHYLMMKPAGLSQRFVYKNSYKKRSALVH